MNTCASDRRSDKSFRGFIRYNLFIILAFVLPAAILSAVFILRSYYPFGNRMILAHDGWHQYYPFLAEYQQMLKEGSSWMYSWNTGGGVNFYGVIANYVASPLYLLTAIIPSGTPWLPAFLGFTVVVRVGCAGMFFAVFLRKVFNRNDISLTVFSLMYALCAYVLGYYWNTMWLDTFALMPLVIAGVVGVLRDRKFSLYIVSLALSVICNFYIGYMVCLFVLLVSICYTIVSFVSIKESLRNAGKMVLYTAIAFMITAVVTIPVFNMLGQSDSAGSVEGFPLKYTINYGYGYKEHNLFNTALTVARTVTNMLSVQNPIKMDVGEPNIACGMLALVLLPFYFVNRKIRLKEKIVSISLLVFFIAGFVVNQLNYIWHAMATPAMVYYRWSFIFSFVVIVMAYRAYTLIDAISKKSLIISCGILFLYLIAALFLQKQLSVIANALGIAVIISGVILYRKGKLKQKTLALLLCLFVICDMSINTFMGVKFVGSTKIDDYPQNKNEVRVLVEAAESHSGPYMYRTEFLKGQTLNDGALNSAYGITTFNSMVDSSYAPVLKEWGLAASVGNNRYEYVETNPVTNLFLNIKYLIGRDGQTVHDEAYFEEIKTAGECTLYENKAAVPTGFMTDKSLLEYTVREFWRFPGDVLNDLFSKASGIGEKVFTEVEPVDELQSDKYEDKLTLRPENPYSYKMSLADTTGKTGESEPVLWVEYEIEADGSYYGLFRSSTDKKTDLIINDDRDNLRELDQHYSNLVSVGTLKKGDKVRVEMNAEFSTTSNINYRLVRINDDVLNKGLEKLRESTMTTTEWSDRGVKGTINVKESGLFYTSVLYCDGWKAYVDGVETPITPVGDAFIAFELSEGYHEIELRFTTPGLRTGALISCGGLLAFAALYTVSVLRRRKKANPVIAEDTESDLVE